MLDDTALPARRGAHRWQATRDEEARRVTTETVEWLKREMTAPGGGFYSSLDADSEGHEGKFYVWTLHELEAALGAEAPLAAEYWGATSGGNFEGRNILHVPNDQVVVAARHGITVGELHARIANAAHVLLAARAGRVRPG